VSAPTAARPCHCGAPHYAKGLCRHHYRISATAGAGVYRCVVDPGPVCPDPVRCACGRAAHPVTGTCLRCGGGWPALDRPDGRAVRAAAEDAL